MRCFVCARGGHRLAILPDCYNRGPWHSLSAVEYATLEYIDWYNNRRLHSQLTGTPRHTTPVAHENAYYNQTNPADPAETHKKQSLPNPG